MNHDTLEGLVAEAAKETAAALQEEEFTARDREEFEAALAGLREADAFRRLDSGARITWKDAFCAVWPYIRKWLEKVKEKVKPWLRWLIALVVRHCDGICGHKE